MFHHLQHRYRCCKEQDQQKYSAYHYPDILFVNQIGVNIFQFSYHFVHAERIDNCIAGSLFHLRYLHRAAVINSDKRSTSCRGWSTGTSNPFTPSFITSGMPPAAVQTGTQFILIASSSAIGNPSNSELIMNISIAVKYGRVSVCNPAKCTYCFSA